jgi:hypothetical protein
MPTLLMRVLVLAGLPALAAIAPATADPVRELSTDRPDLTESPFSVPHGWVQLELDGVVWARDEQNGAVTRTLGVVPINLKLGLSPRHDLQVVYEPWVRARTTSGIGSSSVDEHTGSGELAVRLKVNLLGNDGGRIGLGLLPWVAWDTGVERGRFWSAAGIAVPLAVGLTERTGLGAMLEASESEPGWALLGTATLALDLIGSLGVFGEIAAERVSPDVEPGAGNPLGREIFWVSTLNAGATLGIGPDLQLDGGVRVGVSEAADDLSVFVGLAARRFVR